MPAGVRTTIVGPSPSLIHRIDPMVNWQQRIAYGAVCRLTSIPVYRIQEVVTVPAIPTPRIIQPGIRGGRLTAPFPSVRYRLISPTTAVPAVGIVQANGSFSLSWITQRNRLRRPGNPSDLS